MKIIKKQWTENHSESYNMAQKKISQECSFHENIKNPNEQRDITDIYI